MRFSKRDIEFHSDGYGRPSSPAVNVKIHGSGVDIRRRMWADWAKSSPADEGEVDPRFTEAWVDTHLTETQQSRWWDAAIESAWEDLQESYNAHAELYFWGPATVCAEGRSGGWAVLYSSGGGNYPKFTRVDVDGWDAIQLGKWARFAKWARQEADGVGYQYLSLIYLNVFAPWAEREAAKARPESAYMAGA